MSKFSAVVVVIFELLLVPTILLDAVHGTVKDTEGKPVIDALVTFTDEAINTGIHEVVWKLEGVEYGITAL